MVQLLADVVALLSCGPWLAARGDSVAPSDEYGARVDPWLKRFEQAVRVSENEILVLRLHRGEFGAFGADSEERLELPDDMLQQLRSVFPADALEQRLEDAAWAEKVRQHAAGLRRDPACPVNGENHLERTIVGAFGALKGQLLHRILNVGGLYGGAFGQGAELPDDPTVELLRHTASSGMQVLCWNCGEVVSITRVGAALAGRFTLEEEVDLLSPTLAVPSDFRELDLLRLDFLPGGQSCQVLRRLLRAGVKPRMVAMLVLSQVPPPFRYMPLMAVDGAEAHAAFFSCSLAAAEEVLQPYGLFLVRLTGPYALFVRADEWPEPVPISDLDCYRGAGVWGHQALPIESVRDWLFSDLGEALHHLWGNLTLLHGVGRPFSLAV